MASAIGLRDAESIICNRGCSVASWTFTGRVFQPAQRTVERAPIIYYYNAASSHVCVCVCVCVRACVRACVGACVRA